MSFRTITVEASLEHLAAISDFVVDQARLAGLDEHAVWEVQLAADEAVTNVIQHSYARSPGSITLTTQHSGDTFEVAIRDRGKPFNPDDVPEPDLVSPLEERRTGGLGLYLMRKLMDRVEFRFEDGENILTMTKRIPRANLHVVSLAGRIDAATAPLVNRSVREAMAQGGRQIIIELREVTFLSSSGLRTLLLLARELRREGGDLILCSLQPQVAEVFHLTGFDQIFQLHHTREEAAAGFLKET
jgi:anti-anti-sigma factor